MRFATRLTLFTIVAASGVAHAGAALDEGGAPQRTTDASVAPDTLQVASEKVDYGVDLRLRSVHIPKALLGLFVGHAAGGSSNTGIGVDLVRRRGNLELQLGFEYEHINIAEGVYIQSGHNVPADTVDYILGPDSAPENFGWFTIEFTFLNHTPINKYLSFRYGGGAGLGILSGGVYRWDVQCAANASNSNVEPGCVPGDQITGGTGRTANDDTGAPESTPVKYGFPPVFPVVNAIVGLQIKPTDKAVINLEAGIRTLPFFGMSAGYFF